MELTYTLVQLLAALSVVHASVMHLKETEAGDGVTEAISEEQRKIHQECRNPDYKKYVMCLMRPKRHHHNHGDLPSDNGRHYSIIVVVASIAIVHYDPYRDRNVTCYASRKTFAGGTVREILRLERIMQALRCCYTVTR